MLERNLFQRNDELFRVISFSLDVPIPQQRWRSLLSREATAGHAVPRMATRPELLQSPAPVPWGGRLAGVSPRPGAA